MFFIQEKTATSSAHTKNCRINNKYKQKNQPFDDIPNGILK